MAVLVMTVLTMAELAMAALTFAVLTIAILSMAVLTMAALSMALLTMTILTMMVLTMVMMTMVVLTLAALSMAMLTMMVLAIKHIDHRCIHYGCGDHGWTDCCMTALAIAVLLRPRTQALQFMWRCGAAQSNKKRVRTPRGYIRAKLRHSYKQPRANYDHVLRCGRRQLYRPSFSTIHAHNRVFVEHSASLFSTGYSPYMSSMCA